LRRRIKNYNKAKVNLNFLNATDHFDLAVMASQQKQNQGQSSEKQPEPELQGWFNIILFSLLSAFRNNQRQIFCRFGVQPFSIREVGSGIA